ncbi:putative bifunctional diguanylate cyclase/phosphodiesterase [Noviherbaspirillum sp. ST9]|uniref:putative bifunctional diguanylate cyclase/phosphodiesterase n=1 Tax=Noviherbaspirillum sp. ST9 TaxID=3401606 RepID=UPI003B587A7A
MHAAGDQHALAILYDLALTIGGEVAVEPLMVRTLQRLMYHTGFPVGLWFDKPERAKEGTVRLHLAIGDYDLVRRRGETLEVPAALVEGPPALLDAPELLARLNPRKPHRFALRLPVPGDGVILLLATAAPATRVSLPELFSPVLAGLGRSLTLCRSHEQQVRERVEQTAYYDPLTGLPNAILFANALRQASIDARASGRWVALVHLDIDDFRHVNEKRGSDLGNRILLALARKLGAQLREGEVAARLSGDEFCLLWPDLAGWDDVDERVVRLLQINRMPLEVDGEPLELTFSAGVAVMPPDSEDGDTLARHAQMALHQAKQEARGYFRLFDAEQDKRTHTRRELLDRLKNAMENRELRLFYQPKVELASGTILGFEALLRWHHPERGIVPVPEFLPAVENSDFIVRLGEWSMREALRQVVAWRTMGLETCVSVNIAGRHLLLPDFPLRVQRALDDVPDARPGDLEIEILESSFLGDLGHVRGIMQQCAALGVRFALDDFGTGYSSLAYLHQLPASTIKIDQVFVRNLFLLSEDPAIIQAIVRIADVFGRDLVAEGVEDPEHGMLLVCMGCHAGQGFGISRALAPEAVPAWARSYRPPTEWTRAAGLSWHPLLHTLLHHRYRIRQWREQVEAIMGREDPGLPLPALETAALDTWLRTVLSEVSVAPQVRESLLLIERLHAKAIRKDAHNSTLRVAWLHDLSGTATALLSVLDDIAVKLGTGATKRTLFPGA